MQEPLNFEKEITFFEAEKTGGKIEFEFESIKYYGLIDFDYLFDFIEESNTEEHKYLTDGELAEIFFNYCVNDG